METLALAAAKTEQYGSIMLASSIRLAPLGLMFLIFLRRGDLSYRLTNAAFAIAGAILFQTAFSMTKTLIPSIVPFYADPILASVDEWLHGGESAWQLAHRWAAGIDMTRFVPVYLHVWTIPAVALPLTIALTDTDERRIGRFLSLYVLCWIGLGNLLALAGSSVGPVFYDSAYGTDRFGHLAAALEDTGMTSSLIGMTQYYLWDSYVTGNLAFGSGISAFPSVHVGVATVTALYLFERNKVLVLPGILFLAAIMFLSVYSGYHYAIDGYVSIIMIVGAWAYLVRARENRPEQVRLVVSA
ncbi:phosphatase PAP2 family protein [Albidovulum inexpectatum]|nr:phosphatase PAP2 family protein [Albidovulum inexpectatum]